MMVASRIFALAGLACVSALPSKLSGSSQQALLAPHAAKNPAESRCALPPALDPSGDGLPSASQLFSSDEALAKQVQRHQAIVRVPSISYDDLDDVGKDKRWEVFGELHRVLEETYPLVHKLARLERVNTYGLVYTFDGSDTSMKPILLAAHQDVVPVEDESAWTYPPFSAHYDGRWLWGRGSIDDKSSLTGIMSVLETLFADGRWQPRRTIIVALGIDEECTGLYGAGRIGKHLTERYGDNGLALIVDEGGLGMLQIDDVLYALPSVMERGHLDVWFELHVPGGHSSVPPPHTGIGIMSEIVTRLEANPYKPNLTRSDPIYDHIACIARYSPDSQPELADLFNNDDLEGIMEYFVKAGRAEGYLLTTSQAVDVVAGGQKINAMPEVVTLGVNYRLSPRDSVDKVMNNIVEYIQDVTDKYDLKVETLNADKHSTSDESEDSKWQGKLLIQTRDAFEASRVSPTSGPTWDTFSGSLQHTFAFDGTVVPAGETMLGNTDTRHYLNLSPHIYRFQPLALDDGYDAHTVDERIDMRAHMRVVKFYYDLIRNYDVAKLEGA